MFAHVAVSTNITTKNSKSVSYNAKGGVFFLETEIECFYKWHRQQALLINMED
jgi:hypothetical protein